ncbi:LytR/AlgR family response regulator transcription factor [Mucilaginibacter sp. OK098]|uniref:LytR/AlgR family response regulator transcription factor n=1 Tax=Mucilaginibacter sp. OK098 TaxID=1855297 RepID=UPI000912380F|nr:response regulator transcription factor [Mucilaginibacter sp. OK098]SHM11109.1 two component transcriptional regulator, LytTR family [Mucilaginibacter sp. OK098]
MKKLSVIIIDDERNAREEVKKLLEGYPELEIVGEAKNADEAKELIDLKHPDLLFLDIQMPEKSGFDLLESLDHVPRVIFTTAYDQYAVKAFEVSAIDYLMKPIREERFAKAMEQVKYKAITPNDDRIFVKDRQQYHFISWSNVHLIESMDNYARLYFGDKNVFLKSSLNLLEQKLDKATFFRINRAQIINLKYIEKMMPATEGRLKLLLKTGEEADVSDRQSVKLKKLMKI